MKHQKNEQQHRLIISLAITIITLGTFYHLFTNNFINFDDPGYVTQNGHVQSGLSMETIKWAFQATAEANWHPLTWLSHALDCTLFGLDAPYHHASSLFLHILSSILLFLIFENVTGNRWQSAFVAVVFAIHPLHVESVAWISERKDVLAGLCWMLTMGAYVQYVRSSKRMYFFLTLLAFAVGLLAKPMLVTLPFVLLLLDYWPLGRLRLFSQQGGEKKKYLRSFGEAASEKIPFVILAFASSIVTFIVQQQGKTMMTVAKLSVPERLINAIAAYGEYLKLTFFPSDLAIFYPHAQGNLSLLTITLSIVLLSAISFLVWKQRIERPYLFTGWLWFMGTLIPVIGLVQVGMQAYADRYMYLPMIGILLMIAWGFPSLLQSVGNKKIILSAACVFVLFGLMFGTVQQTARWKNSATLFEHTLSVTTNNYLAHHCLGADLADSGKTEEAITHFREVLRIEPGYAPTHNNLGVALAKQGKFDEAATHWTRATEINPQYADAFSNLGRLYSMQGKGGEAAKQFERALQLEPNHIQARFNYGNLLTKEGRIEEAKLQFAEALRIAPGFKPAQAALQKLGK